jgi:hypothetical protein
MNKKLSIYEQVKADVDDEIYAMKKKVQKKHNLTWKSARDMVNQSVKELYDSK